MDTSKQQRANNSVDTPITLAVEILGVATGILGLVAGLGLGSLLQAAKQEQLKDASA